ncbi:tetratricopeptide repeat protein [Capnocytophaga stomatis]|uniref:tetratricopeptide repeat protein n=1 Tax=Capnocytophaga stomatis TaxID=1848904 RepID=UPI001AC86844|nr:tetratricopeptide repeat protein [Capnocytophaga stomatis]GIM49840.1 hypothetical protein CAPN003_12920 [Capnocytophaga stomatis]
MKRNLFYIAFLIGFFSFAQNREAQEMIKSKEISKKYTHQGNNALKNDQPVQAEVDYRNAIAKNKDNGIAQYNLGTMYYKQKSYDEAFTRLKNASTSSEISSEEKHQIFHNLGNTFMQEKAYDKAVQAYKEALRNNPTDEETRYNLAVAQELLKKNPPKPEENKDQNNQNQQNQDNKDQQNNQNSQNNQDKKDENKENQDKKDPKDDKNKEKDDQNKQNKDNNQDKDPKKPDQNKEDKNQEGEGKGQNRPSSLSPQQMERILEAMNNEDQKTQEKINAQKVKGNRSKSEKDW